jgi:DNA-binding transcriptional LysR family regulator
MAMDTLISIRVFCLVAELKSFVAAAQRMGISQAMASKHVIHLERRLGARLLNRTSRHLSLTEAGALYFAQSSPMIDALDEVEAAVTKATVMPRGTLKITAPVWLANPSFVSVLADYQARYPDVRLDVDLSGRIVNMVEEGVDLALRVARSPGEALIARPIGTVQFYLVGAPTYLQKSGRPRRAAELANHAMLLYSLMPNPATVPFVGPQGRESVRLIPTLQSSNESLLHLAALQGMGLAFLPKCLIAHDLQAGRLEHLLPDHEPFELKLLAVYPSRRYLSSKVRTFLDFLVGDGRLK